MSEQLGYGSVAHGSQAQQTRIVAKRGGQFSLANGLRGAAHQAGHFDRGGAAQLFHGEFEHRPVQAEARLANLELGGVNAHGNAPGARGQVVAGEGALAALVHFAVSSESERMGWNDHAPAECFAKVHQNFPSVVSKCVGLLRVEPPIRIQCATHSIICSKVTVG